MTKNTFGCVVSKLLVILACVSLSFGTMGPKCSSLKSVEIHHKKYFDIYLTSQYGAKQSGIFYNMIKQAIKLCCPSSAVNFIAISDNTVQSVEEILVETVKTDNKKPEDGVLKLFFPEFADKTALDIYDSTTPFIRLSRSPGHAVVMVKPAPKEPVFVGEIIVKSWAILIFLVTFAWVVGILAWISDHHVNPKDFPNPFYVGMFEGFWWSVVTMTTVGYGDKAPKGIIARLLTVLWIMISTVFLALFTANATSILAISQAEDDHSITLGKRMGVLNSKHFVEVELNLGSTIIEYSTTLGWTLAATQNSDVDRLIFPNYIDFLLFVKDEKYKRLLKNAFVLTNAVKNPFQIGMPFAAKSDNMTALEGSFLSCMRSVLPTLERQTRKAYDLSAIEFTENTNTKELKTALDSDNLLMMTYYFFGIIAVLVVIGLGWDLWMYWFRTRPDNRRSSAQAGDLEMNDGEPTEFNDVDQSGGSLSGNVVPDRSGTSAQTLDHWGKGVAKKYKMSITVESSDAPPPPESDV